MEYLFSLNKINRLRRKAQKAAELKGLGFDIQGWSENKFEAEKLLAVFEPLKVRESIKLKAYLYRSGANGNGIIRAVEMPVGLAQQTEIILGNDLFDPPKPVGCLDNLMDGIEGDGSPWSYLCASLFAREAAEFGALWHGVNWSTHDLYAPESSTVEFGIVNPDLAELVWNRIPRDFKPKVIIDLESVKVIFYTFSGLGRSGVYEHVDTYKNGSYVFETNSEKIADGGMGYIF